MDTLRNSYVFTSYKCYDEAGDHKEQINSNATEFINMQKVLLHRNSIVHLDKHRVVVYYQ